MEENKNMPDFLIDYNNYLVAIKNMSTVYIKNMAVTILQFLNYINIYKLNNKYDLIHKITLNDIRTITNSDVYNFMFYLAEKHYKVSSRITKTEHLRTFFDYLYRIKHNLFQEPLKKIKREKKPVRKLPNYLSLEESKKLLGLYADSTNIIDVRNNAIIHLLLNCGLRISELSNLNLSDFNFKSNTFIIFGKGNKERTGYLNESTRNALLKYLEIRNTLKPKSKQDNDAFFLSEKRIRICPRGIRHMIKLSYEKAEIKNKNYSVHTLRHTCATILYKIGTDIKIIKELLGHARIETTDIYTHLFDKNVMEAMFKHPLAKFKMANAMEFCVVQAE